MSFTDAASATAAVSFPQAGLYLLRLEAADGTLSAGDTLVVRVEESTSPAYLHPSPTEAAYSPDGSRLAVIDAGLGRLCLLDPSTPAVLERIPVAGVPKDVAWNGNRRVFVSEYDAGSVAEIEATDGRVIRRLRVGPKPHGLAVDTGRQRLIVTDFGLNEARIIDLASGAEVARVGVGYQPMFVTLTPDESLAIVANSMPFGDAREEDHAATLTLINPDDPSAVSHLALPPGSTSLRHLEVSPDGRWLYLAHLLGRTNLPTSQLSRGWVFKNVVDHQGVSARSARVNLPRHPDSPTIPTDRTTR